MAAGSLEKNNFANDVYQMMLVVGKRLLIAGLSITRKHMDGALESDDRTFSGVAFKTHLAL